MKNTGKAYTLERKRSKLNKLPVAFVLFCIIPSCALVLTFMIIPAIQSVLLSFQSVGALSMKGSWIKLENYAYLIKDEAFKKAFLNTIKLILVVPVCTIATSFIIAFILQEVKLREKQMYITVFFLPSIVSATIISVVWSYMFHPNSGIVNKLLEMVGLGTLKHAWLGDAETALWCIGMVLCVCCFGYYMIMHMAGMAEISPEIYDSAVIDGAGFWTKFSKITFPLMKNQIGITIVLCMANVLSGSFTYCKLMTNGGPNGASTVLLHYVYTQGLENGNMGYSSAISVVTIILAFVLSFVSRKLSRDEV